MSSYELVYVCPHATMGREIIGKLITQGHDKICPQRMDDQELLVVMTATIRHMPLVTQLHRNTSVITKEIRKFRTVVHTFIDQIRNNLEIVLETLLKGTRRVPEFEVSILESVKLPRRRPQTSKLARPTRSEIHRRIDRFSGIEQVYKDKYIKVRGQIYRGMRHFCASGDSGFARLPFLN